MPVMRFGFNHLIGIGHTKTGVRVDLPTCFYLSPLIAACRLLLGAASDPKQTFSDQTDFWHGSYVEAPPPDTGNRQPRRIAIQRSAKHNPAPTTATGTGGKSKRRPMTSTSAPASAATA